MPTPSDSASADDPLALDLTTGGWLPPLVQAFIGGRSTDLLAPLRLLDSRRPHTSGEIPAAEPSSGPDRSALAAGLASANAACGHPGAHRLAERLADPATRVVVTGQQPGLFGGPLYTLSKAVAAARHAAALEEAGIPAVAVFWVATEDHDFDEVARTTVLTPEGPRSFDLGADPEPLVPVGARGLGPAVEAILAELASLPGGPSWEGWWREVGAWYRPQARFGEAFARLLVRLLGERCPLLLDSQLPELKAAQRPWLRRFVEERAALESAYRQADAAIEAAGFPLQVTPQPGLSPLFLLADGQRRRIEWLGEDGWRLRGAEGVGGTVDELLARIDDNPITASPGVRARPAVQDAVLGTALQILGPGELSYMPQVAPAYRTLGIPAPAIALRPQVVVLEGKHIGWMEEAGLTLPLLLGDEKALHRHLAERAEVNLTGELRESLERQLDVLRERALALDKNLEKPWEKTRDNVLRSLDAFASRVDRAAAQGDDIQRRRVEQLRATVLPEGRPQERTLSSAHFPGRLGDAFAEALYEQLDLDARFLRVVRV